MKKPIDSESVAGFGDSVLHAFASFKRICASSMTDIEHFVTVSKSKRQEAKHNSSSVTGLLCLSCVFVSLGVLNNVCM